MTLSEKIAFIERVFGRFKLARDCMNVAVRCPVCAPVDPNKLKFVIRTDNDVCHCWVCGYKSYTLVPVLKKHGSREQFLEYTQRFLSARDRKAHVNERAVESDERVMKLPDDFKLIMIDDLNTRNSQDVMLYVKNRGLSERDLWYNKIGVSNEERWQRRVIVPSFDANGTLNYFVGRSIDSWKRPKYDSLHFDKLPIIFNELNVNWSQRLTICEGVFDAFKCGENVVPLLGSDLNEQSALFNKILVSSTPIALALDGDMWDTKTMRIAKKLSEYDIDVNVVDTREFGDPGAASKETFKSALDKAISFDWSVATLNRLNVATRVKL